MRMSESPKFPLVITTALSPGPGVPYLAVEKGRQRTQETLYSILWWICQSDFTEFVVIDATNDGSLKVPLETLAAACGKKLEFFAAPSDSSLVIRYGKGYGEGMALETVFDESQILRGAMGFFKCTGKLIVLNYQACVRQAMHRDFFFDAPRNLPKFVDTRFYFASKDFWNKHLRAAYRAVNDPAGKFLEHAYFDAITQAANIPFNPVVIRYSGVSGTSGHRYDISERHYRFLVALRTARGVLLRLTGKASNGKSRRPR
jgi:hypothetical protein